MDALGAAFEQGLYVVVVVDHRLGPVESYGPLDPGAAANVMLDLRALLAEQGLDEIRVTTARLHPPAQPVHPDDP
ncbi:hypothetical protein [Actinomycetospora sp.]|jgi:hypothetical protein|uniref:hypothetical protein n=1 Tax=Actinomycetospora sp. TaxID=1872135 RepID=UPI002F3EE069